MARTRNLKPGFFTNDVLAEVAPLGRLLFQGLWCHADRAGRLLDRPRKLKAEILPYDTCDVEKLLESLQSKGFIARYESGSERYIQIAKFAKHQNPHVKEPESEIPAQGEHQTRTGQAEEIPEPSGPSSLTLNPSTLTLPPESGAEDRRDVQVYEIAAIYPRIKDPMHLSGEDQTAIYEAIARHGFEQVIRGTFAVVAWVREYWPKTEWCYLQSTSNFFRKSEYMGDPQQLGDKRNEKRGNNSNASTRSERSIESLDIALRAYRYNAVASVSH